MRYRIFSDAKTSERRLLDAVTKSDKKAGLQKEICASSISCCMQLSLLHFFDHQ